ncbi:MAG: YggU family protein [Deltaproteobacteria bacterium]|nr:MAG: YggU family protein [Deltaproteobacteria bacterium]
MGEGKHREAKIRVKVIPGASKNQIVGLEDGLVRIKIAAPPVKGKANKTLRDYLAKRLRVKKGDIEITSGEHSRVKTVSITGMDEEEVIQVMLRAISAQNKSIS